MFNVTQLSALCAQTQARRIVDLRRREGDRQVPRGRGRGRLLLEVGPPTSTRSSQSGDQPDDRAARGRRRRHASCCTPRGRRRRRRASSTRATRCATRPRRSAGAGGSTGDDIYLDRVRVRLRRRPRLRLLPRAAAGRDRRAADPLGRRGGAAARSRSTAARTCCAMPTHAADMIRAAQATDRDLSSMRVLAGAGPHARAPPGDARRPSASRRWPTTGSRRCPATPRMARRAGREDGRAPRAGPTTGPRSASSAATTRRCRRARSAPSSSTGRAASWASWATTT